MRSTRSAARNVSLTNTVCTPEFNLSRSLESRSRAVMTTTGIFRHAASFCNAATTAKPSISGIIRSSKITSGLSCWRRSSASRPFDRIIVNDKNAQKAYDELEKRVEERTTELKEARARLQYLLTVTVPTSWPSSSTRTEAEIRTGMLRLLKLDVRREGVRLCLFALCDISPRAHELL